MPPVARLRPRGNLCRRALRLKPNTKEYDNTRHGVVFPANRTGAVGSGVPKGRSRGVNLR